MLSLSHTTGHAIQALTCLADENCTHGGMIQHIAECSGVPRPYLAKVLRRLNEAGIVKSKRGYRGGIWLARPAEKISLMEISEAIDGEEYFNSCLLGSAFCGDDRDCPTHTFWKGARKNIQEELASTTLADVVAFHQRKAAEKKRKPSVAARRR